MTSDILSHAEVACKIDLLSAWIEAQMAYKGPPGLSIGIVHDQDLVWARGFGYADVDEKAEATPRTLYRIASITKLFTATAVLQLRDAGKLQLDDPVTKRLDWFEVRNRHPDAPPITIRHLLTHTSGLPREAAFPYWTDDQFPTRRQLRETLPRQETILPTETEWKYSNLALSLAGKIVAAVSGQEYPDYVQQQILDPLGMESTLVRPPDPDHPLLATGYGRRMPDNSRDIAPTVDCQSITPAANMTSSVKDLARFIMLQFRDGPAGGSQVLRGSTLREMQRVHWLAPDWQVGRGLGFHITRQKGKTYIDHGGGLKGYVTLVIPCPVDKIGVVALTNANDGDPRAVAEKAFEWVAPAILKVAKPRPEAKEPDPAWQRYVGRYREFWGDAQVLVLDGDLVLINPTLPDPTEAMAKLVPVAEHVFRTETKEGFGANGELVVFEVDGEGKVARVKTGENYIYPVAEW
jgi:D-alanyl-D-alanine carboxypeptidase